MPEEIGLFEAMHTQRAIRHFKPDPVPDELITKILEAAIRAPNAVNTQNWAFMVVKDAETRRKVADYYRMAPGPNPDDLPQPQRRIYREANEFAQRLHEVPVFIIPCIIHDGSPPSNPAFGRGSFIFPAVQNILLAARGLGLGSILTGRHTRFDKEVKEILGIPDNVDTAALLPIGYIADGHGYGPTRRHPLKEVVFTDRWGNNWEG